jgi:sec-independent protein translocase protein TatA
MNMMLGLFNLGGGEVILILCVVLLLFGAKKIPEFAKGLGSGIKEFKKAAREVTDEVQNAMEEHPAPTPQKKLPAATVVTTEAEHSIPQSSPGQKA